MIPGAADLETAFTQAAHTVFRLETLQHYAGYEGVEWDMYQAGHVLPHRDSWYQRTLSAQTHAGVTWSRVHVVREPLTDYVAFELIGYHSNVANGEDVRIIPVSDTWPRGVPVEFDFWIVDTKLWDMDYDRDGTWHGAYRNDDPAAVAEARRIRDAAWAQSVPWVEYMHRHPHLLAQVPDMASA